MATLNKPLEITTVLLNQETGAYEQQTVTIQEFGAIALRQNWENEDQDWLAENYARAQNFIDYLVDGKISDQDLFNLIEPNKQVFVARAISLLANYWISQRIFSEGESTSASTGALSYSQTNQREKDFVPSDVRQQLRLAGLFNNQELITSSGASCNKDLTIKCIDDKNYFFYGENQMITYQQCVDLIAAAGGYTTNTEQLPTVNQIAEGGPNQKVVNEAIQDKTSDLVTGGLTSPKTEDSEDNSIANVLFVKNQAAGSGSPKTKFIIRTRSSEGSGDNQMAINIAKETKIKALVKKTANIDISTRDQLGLGEAGKALIEMDISADEQEQGIDFYAGLTTQLELSAQFGAEFRKLPMIKRNEAIPDLTDQRQFVTWKHLMDATVPENEEIELLNNKTQNLNPVDGGVRIDKEDNNSIVSYGVLQRKIIPLQTDINTLEGQTANIDADGNVAEYTADIVTANRKKFASIEHLIGITNTMSSNSTRLNHVEAKTVNLDTNGRVINQPTQANDIATKTYVDSQGGGGGGTDTYVNWVEGTLPTYHETLTLLDLKNTLDDQNTDKITFYSNARVQGGARTEMLKAFGVLDYVATYTQLGTAFRDGDWTGPNAIQDGDYLNSTKGVEIGIGFTSFQQDSTTQTLTDNDWRSKPNGAQGEFQGTRFFCPKSVLEGNENKAWIFGQAQSGFGNRSLSVAFHLDNDFTTGTPLPDLLVKLKAWIVDTSSNTAVDTVELATVHDGEVSNVVPQTGEKERNTIFINDYTYRRFDTKARILSDYGVANRALVYFYTINFKNDNNGSPYKLKNVRTFVSRVNRAYKEDELDYYGANVKITLARGHADNSGASYSLTLSSKKRIGYFEIPFGSMIEAQALRTGIGRALLFPVENNLWFISPLVNKDERPPMLLEASSDITNMGTENIHSVWQDLQFNMIVRNRAKGYDEAFILDTNTHSFTIPHDTHRKGIKKLFLITMSGPGFLHQQQQRFRIVDASVPTKSPLATGAALGSWSSTTAVTASQSYRSNGYALFFYAELETGRPYKPQFFTSAWGSGKPNPNATDKFFIQMEEKF